VEGNMTLLKGIVVILEGKLKY